MCFGLMMTMTMFLSHLSVAGLILNTILVPYLHSLLMILLEDLSYFHLKKMVSNTEPTVADLDSSEAERCDNINLLLKHDIREETEEIITYNQVLD